MQQLEHANALLRAELAVAHARTAEFLTKAPLSGSEPGARGTAEGLTRHRGPPGLREAQPCTVARSETHEISHAFRNRLKSRVADGGGGGDRSPSPAAAGPRARMPQRHGLWEVWLGVIVCSLVWFRQANQLVDSLLQLQRADLSSSKLSPREPTEVIDWPPLVMLLPLAALMYYDYHSEEKRFLRMIPDKTMNYILRVAGGYGIVQVLAQVRPTCAILYVYSYISAAQHSIATVHNLH